MKNYKKYIRKIWIKVNIILICLNKIKIMSMPKNNNRIIINLDNDSYST